MTDEPTQPSSPLQPGDLHEFSRYGRLAAIAGAIMALAKAGLAAAHANRASVITDVGNQAASLADVQSADDLIRQVGWVAVAASIAWIVVMILWSQRITRLHVDTPRFAMWQKALFVTVIVNVGLSFLLRTNAPDTLAGLRTISHRQVVLNILQLLPLVAVTVLGVLLKRDVERDQPHVGGVAGAMR